MLYVDVKAYTRTLIAVSSDHVVEKCMLIFQSILAQSIISIRLLKPKSFSFDNTDPSKDIDRLLLVAHETQQAENRKILVNVVRCLLFLTKQNIALRSNDDDGIPELDSRSQENFRNLILFRIEAGDSVLSKHLTNCSKNATYLSPSELHYALSLFVHSGTHEIQQH